MASGSDAAACASASTKVSGVGAAGVVGVAGSPIADATWASLAVTAGLSMSPICRASLTSFCSEVMTLAGERPVATSLTSSKLFLRSAISASRMASWNWPWNSDAIRRALPIHCPTMRRTPGSSLGPIAISATTPMTSSSLHPISNMKKSAYASAPLVPPCPGLSEQVPSLRERAPPAPFTHRSNGLAADIRAGGRRSRAVIDRLDRLGLLRRLVVVLHALLEGLDALRDVAHQIRNLAAPEQQQDAPDHDDPVPN